MPAEKGGDPLFFPFESPEVKANPSNMVYREKLYKRKMPVNGRRTKEDFLGEDSQPAVQLDQDS